MWKMILAFSFVIYQIPFDTEALCEKAKTKLVEQHDIRKNDIACVQVKSGGVENEDR